MLYKYNRFFYSRTVFLLVYYVAGYGTGSGSLAQHTPQQIPQLFPQHTPQQIPQLTPQLSPQHTPQRMSQQIPPTYTAAFATADPAVTFSRQSTPGFEHLNPRIGRSIWFLGIRVNPGLL